MSQSSSNDTFKLTPVIYFIFIITVLAVGIGSFFAGRISVSQKPTVTDSETTTQVTQVSQGAQDIQPTAEPVVEKVIPVKSCTSAQDCGEGGICENGMCKVTCKTNAQCNTGSFCYQGHCYGQYYCKTNADCEIGGACQKPCAGKECTTAEVVCSIRTKLNAEQNKIDDKRGCMPAACKSPLSVQCVDNNCVSK